MEEGKNFKRPFYANRFQREKGTVVLSKNEMAAAQAKKKTDGCSTRVPGKGGKFLLLWRERFPGKTEKVPGKQLKCYLQSGGKGGRFRGSLLES